MAVYIFPVDPDLDVQDIQSQVKARGLTVLSNQGMTYREGKDKVYSGSLENGKIVETIVKDSAIFIDSELPFTLTEIKDDFSFGNGTTIAAVSLKNGTRVKCGWVVIDHANIAAANGMLTALKNIFKEQP